jgi:hypothetical protein
VELENRPALWSKSASMTSMRTLVALGAAVGLGASVAKADVRLIAPGAPVAPGGGGWDVTLLDDSLEALVAGASAHTSATPPGGGSAQLITIGVLSAGNGLLGENGVFYRHYLPFAVTPGDLVLTERGGFTSDSQVRNSPSVWSDVIRFHKIGVQYVADLYSWDDFSGFVSQVGPLSANWQWLAEKAVPGSEDAGYQGGATTDYIARYGPLTGNLNKNSWRIESVVPEPSTFVAGALLVFALAGRILRTARSSRAE